jgi:hypothetical protein
MSLFVPTSVMGPVPFAGWPTNRGQLYNLDNDEYIGFQFNPETFEWEQPVNWVEVTWHGDFSGGDVQFINMGARVFELPLQFLADPGAPQIDHRAAQIISRPEDKFDFAALKAIIDQWNRPIPGKGRPARLKIIVGHNVFEGVITRWRFKIVDFFPDMTAKEVLLTISFREWVLNVV